MLHTIAWVSLGLAFACAIVIAFDQARHPQKMWIMNIVWPVTALYFSVFAVWAYFRAGRSMTKGAVKGMSEQEMKQHQEQHKEQARRSPSWKQTALSDSHCGAGCTLADIVTEFTVFGVGATWLGKELYASYLWTSSPHGRWGSPFSTSPSSRCGIYQSVRESGPQSKPTRSPSPLSRSACMDGWRWCSSDGFPVHTSMRTNPPIG